MSPWCIFIIDAHRLSFIIDPWDIFIQALIFLISACVILDIIGCIFIMWEQRLLFIIAVVDIRLQDIIAFMSDAETLAAISDRFILPLELWDWAGPAKPNARTAEAKMILVVFMIHLKREVYFSTTI